MRVPAGVELDLGASAKALAADHAARAALARAGSGVLVSLGGDVAVAGRPPRGGWTIRVSDDHADRDDGDRARLAAHDGGGDGDRARLTKGEGGGAGDGAAETIAIADGGLATSGTTVRRWVAGGELRHHVIDPRTGAPARTPWRTVAVAAASCVDANAATTAALVRGADAPRWLQSLGLPARLVATDGAVLHVGDWPRPAGSSRGADAPRRAAAPPRVRFVPLESR